MNTTENKINTRKLIVTACNSFESVTGKKAKNATVADIEQWLGVLRGKGRSAGTCRTYPFYVRDGLEEIKALENNDSFDLARMRLYLEEAIKTVDQAADRQNKMGDVYNALRNHKKVKPT